MKKPIIVALLLFLLINILIFSIFNTQFKRNSFDDINKTIINLQFIKKDFNLHLKNSKLSDKIALLNQDIDSLKNNQNSLNENIKNINNKNLNNQLVILNKEINRIVELFNKTKKYKLDFSNSLKDFENIYKQKISSRLNHVYKFINSLNSQEPYIKMKKLKSIITILPFYKNEKEFSFLQNAKNIIDKDIKIDTLNKEINKINLIQELKTFQNIFNKYSNSIIKNSYYLVAVLFLPLLILTIVYVIYEYKLIKSNDELYKFKHAVENSDNIVVITDRNENIKYVNAAFTKTTGYTYSEAIGQKPSILKSGKQSEDFYRNMKETIFSGKVWSGEFINVDKYGDLSYEKASIAPVVDKQGNIKEFIAIKLDMTNERISENKVKEQEKLLVQQSKMASMGEMLENIAHQWRQPLSVISTISSGLVMKKMLNEEIDDKELFSSLNNITDTSKHLSETIDSFRNFFKIDKSTSSCILSDIYRKSKKLVSSKFASLEIDLIEEIDKTIKIDTFEGELTQVLMNIFSNSKDCLEKLPQEHKKLIFVKIYKDNENAFISIKDNGGGIPEDLINRIFEPYFTTKHKSTGTGIGLYMSQEMVERHMKGKIIVHNEEYEYENIDYIGANFTISLPL